MKISERMHKKQDRLSLSLYELQNLYAMTSIALRKKVHQYVDDVEENVLEAVYQMLKIYVDEDGKSLMNAKQKAEIDKRARLYRQGKLKTSTWEEVKKRTRSAR